MPVSKVIKKNRRLLAERLNGLLDEKGWSQSDLVRASQTFTWGAVRAWCYAVRFPRPRYVIELGRVFSRDPASLLEGIDVPRRWRGEFNRLLEEAKVQAA